MKNHQLPLITPVEERKGMGWHLWFGLAMLAFFILYAARVAYRTPDAQVNRMNKSPTLAQLGQIMRGGAMPKDRTIFLGIDHRPPRRNAIEIASAHLPSDADCRAVAGLSVILNYRGYATAYGTLKRLYGALYAARPKRLLLVDTDTKRIAFLVLGGKL